MTESEKLGIVIMVTLIVLTLLWGFVMIHEDLKQIQKNQAKIIKAMEEKTQTETGELNHV